MDIQVQELIQQHHQVHQGLEQQEMEMVTHMLVVLKIQLLMDQVVNLL